MKLREYLEDAGFNDARSVYALHLDYALIAVAAQHQIEDLIDMLPYYILDADVKVEDGETDYSFNLYVKYADDPQKVAIPKEIAKWIDYCSFTNTPPLRALEFDDVYTYNWALTAKYRDKIVNWLSNTDNQKKFIAAMVNDYEIEQEKLYTVAIPDPYNHNRSALYRNARNNIVIFRINDALWRTIKDYQLTEEEIKKNFAWALDAGFAKEVKNDE